MALDREWTRVGRSLAADIRFDDPTVSRRHALFVRQADGVRVLDDRSLNGVFVNGERVEWRELFDGDEILIGRFRLSFIDSDGDSSDEDEDLILSLGPADEEWREQIGPLLTAAEVRSQASAKSQIAVRVELGTLLGLPTEDSARRLYPAFQFDEYGQPYPVVSQIWSLFAEIQVDPFTAAAWFTSPSPELGGQTPARRIAIGGDQGPVIRAARRAVARLAR